jgi:hypothetical protein
LWFWFVNVMDDGITVSTEGIGDGVGVAVGDALGVGAGDGLRVGLADGDGEADGRRVGDCVGALGAGLVFAPPEPPPPHATSIEGRAKARTRNGNNFESPSTERGTSASLWKR